MDGQWDCQLMSGVLAAFGGYGVSQLDSQVVTSGSASLGTDPYYNYYGYDSSISMGSIADGTSNLYGGAAINGLFFYEEGSTAGGGYTRREINLVIAGTQANSGWSTMTIGTTTYNRTEAVFATAGGESTWTWPIAIIPYPGLTSGVPGPFSATTTVTWA